MRISIHALREEGDYLRTYRTYRYDLFLSTPSARRATCQLGRIVDRAVISIHALREEGDVQHLRRRPVRRHFYPRPPRGGRRSMQAPLPLQRSFLSTPSARRATCTRCLRPACFLFLSTPSARRATLTWYSAKKQKQRFLSTPSARRATRTTAACLQRALFLSTPSARRATKKHRNSRWSI